MFIAVEGIDGSGKSTTLKELEKYLLNLGHKVFLTVEPTEMESGKIIREILAKKEEDAPLTHELLALLFAADRLNHLREQIWPALKRKETVVTDRYFFSSIAYQSVNVSYEWVKGINRFAMMPDLLIYIDVSIDKALMRLSAFRQTTELYETRAYLEQIKASYETVLADFSKFVKIVRLDGNLKMDEIYSDIEKKFEGVL
ncbi:MAG: dTMP kinase [bacterium]